MKNKKRILSGLLAAALVVPLFAGSAQTAAAAEAAGKQAASTAAMASRSSKVAVRIFCMVILQSLIC